METRQYGGGILTISDFLSESECAELIERGEAKGYAEATINAIQGELLLKEVRNNDRVI